MPLNNILKLLLLYWSTWDQSIDKSNFEERIRKSAYLNFLPPILPPPLISFSELLFLYLHSSGHFHSILEEQLHRCLAFSRFLIFMALMLVILQNAVPTWVIRLCHQAFWHRFQNVSFQIITYFQNGIIPPEPVTEDTPRPTKPRGPDTPSQGSLVCPLDVPVNLNNLCTHWTLQRSVWSQQSPSKIHGKSNISVWQSRIKRILNGTTKVSFYVNKESALQ